VDEPRRGGRDDEGLQAGYSASGRAHWVVGGEARGVACARWRSAGGSGLPPVPWTSRVRRAGAARSRAGPRRAPCAAAFRSRSPWISAGGIQDSGGISFASSRASQRASRRSVSALRRWRRAERVPAPARPAAPRSLRRARARPSANRSSPRSPPLGDVWGAKLGARDEKSAISRQDANFDTPQAP
jgi:hypothetical protein